MSGGSVGKGDGDSKTKIRIPRFLRPLIDAGVDIGVDALGDLEGLLGGATGDDLVAPFDPAQLLAQGVATSRALGAGGFFPTAQNEALRTAQGVGLEEFISGDALDALSGLSGGGLDFLSPEVLSALDLTNTDRDVAGTDILRRTVRSAVPQSVRDTLTGVEGVDTTILEQLLGSGPGVPASALDALTSTASGDFLLGGEGFDAAVDAAIRAVTPQVRTLFGRQGGVGAGTGSLAEAAIAESGIDAFAKQFASERRNQLDAAGVLADLGITERGQSADIASVIADFERAGDELGVDASAILGDLSLADIDRASRVGSDLADIDLSLDDVALDAANIFGNLSDSAEGRRVTSSSILADLGLAERGNQLDILSLLPDLATADIDLLDRVGSTRQDLQQRRLTAPIDAQLQLLAAALGVVPTESLLGSKTSGERRGFSLGFGEV